MSLRTIRTARLQYVHGAAAASDLHAVDTHPEPVDPARYHDAVQSVRERHERNAGLIGQQELRAVLAEPGVVPPAQAWSSRIAMRGNGLGLRVDVAQNAAIRAAGDSVKLRTGRDSGPAAFANP